MAAKANKEHVKDFKDGALSSTTLFVRNLPFTTENKDLEKIFSDIGPVKRCFVVKDKDIGKCRGFGYVTFALKEDAARAKDTIRHVYGRKVFITFSNKKPRHKERGIAKETKEDNGDNEPVDNINMEEISLEISPSETPLKDDQKPKHKRKSERAPATNDDGRTVVLSGFLATINVKQLKKACKRVGELEQFTCPVENYEQPTAHALFKSHKVARIAVNNLNGKTVKGSVLNAVLLSKQNKQTSLKSLKKSRLIVRNLPFKCSKEILMNKFSKFGEISEVVLPTKTVGKDKKKLGFAFVQFKTVFDAAKALQVMNQKEIKGRPIAVDWTLPKKKYELLKRSQVDEKTFDGDQHMVDKNEDEDEDEDEVQEFDQEDDSVVLDEGEQESKSESDEECAEEKSEIEGSGSDEEISGKIDKKKKKLRDAREGKTIFIRNLPFDASEEEICGLFEKFGKTAYCKIVMDELTGHSRGSAFVKFEEKESAQDCLRNYNADDDDEDGEELILRNRPLNITLAVPRGKVPQLISDKGSTKKPLRDKRNLYLAKEGVITPASATAAGLSKGDIQKRLKAEAEKKAKLKMPHYIVSKTRLCFRNLPLNVDNKKLSEILRKVCEGKAKKTGKTKIMRSTDRVDSSGVGRSKGFGFVEFFTHEDALEVLRATNNNPEIFGPDRRPIVEFAIENSLILKRQEQRKAKNLQKVKEAKRNQGLNEDKEKSEKRKGLKRKKGRKDRRSHSEGPSSDPSDKPIQPRKMQATNKTISTDVNGEKPSERATKSTVKKGFSTKTYRQPQGTMLNASTVNKSGSSVRNPNSLSRTKHKQREKVNKEEEKFNEIVEKYKTKLFGDNTKHLKTSRWFEG